MRQRAAVRAAPVLALAVVSGAVALVLRLTVFRHLSLDNDESVYLLQARELAHGHLRVPLGTWPDAQQPWFFATTAHGYVAKYLPVAPLLYAAALRVTGSVTPALVLLAALLPLLVHRLARLAHLTDRRALLATALVTLSPAALVQGGLVLSYLPFLVLVVGAWCCLVALAERPGLATAAGFGALGALAGSTRPYDTVLLLGPPVAWVLVRRPGVRVVAAALVGVVPVAALVLGYDEVVTGSALRLPFGLLEPQDRIGYGTRRLFPEDHAHHFGVVQGLQGAGAHFFAEPFSWFLAGGLLLPLALWALRPGGPATTPLRVLALSGLALVVGYLPFWGPWNVSVLWNGTQQIGPFYALPLLVPLALAAASGVSRTRSWLAGLLALVALVPNVVTTSSALADTGTDAHRLGVVLGAVDHRGARPLLLDADPPYVGHPISLLTVGGPGSSVLLPSQLPAADLAAASGGWLLQLPEDLYTPGLRFSYAVREARLVSGTSLAVDVSIAGGPRSDVVVVERGRDLFACTGAVALVIDQGGVSSGCTRTSVPKGASLDPYRLCPTSACLSLQYFSGVFGHRRRVAYRKLVTDDTGSGVALLVDGPYVARTGGGWIAVERRASVAASTTTAASR